MSDATPTLQELRDKLDALMALVHEIANKPTPARIEYSIKEFAPLVGLSPKALRYRPVWKRYGGIKRGRNVRFPGSAVQAINAGQKLASR